MFYRHGPEIRIRVFGELVPIAHEQAARGPLTGLPGTPSDPAHQGSYVDLVPIRNLFKVGPLALSLWHREQEIRTGPH